ncbi:MAG TPA: hypothetical protein VNB24_09200 [Acidimicrobiales bacterium]|nr:hypothetical protein [Acidimicrobiales bacterium]
MGKARTKVIASGITVAYLLGNVVCVILGLVLFAASRPSAPPGTTASDRGIQEPLGISILAAGVVGLVSLGYVLLSERTRERILVLHEFGVDNYFDTNATSLQGVYRRHFNDGNKDIDIIGTGLNKLRRDFFHDGSNWYATRRVRILLLDPVYPDIVYSYATQRDIEENDKAGTIEANVDQWKTWCSALPAPNQHSLGVTIRLYTCLPTLTMVRVGNRIFWAPYMIHRGASSTPTMVVRRGGHLYEVLEKHFDEIWNDDALSRPLL